MHVDQTTFRSYANKSNNYLIDRDVQRNETFTGIEGINAQDRAIQESMGRDRRPLARASGAGGQGDHPVAQETPRRGPRGRGRRHADGLGTTYYDLRAGEGVLPRDADWRQELTPTMRPEQILQTV